MIRKVANIVALVFWLGVIFYLSSQDGTASSSSSGVFVDFLSPYVPITPETLTVVIRKSAHVFKYFILGLLVFNVLRYYTNNLRKIVIYSMLFAVLYATSDEIHQSFVPGRSPEITDVLLDTFGASLGVALFWYIARLKSRKLVENGKE